ncbi:hypothetical protein CAS74_002028 [Pichia kudriavzevii]|nr:hypothetical protein CAS74_002028 [Pichia kudriavzevii]
MNVAFDKLMTVLPNTCMRPLDGESETLSWKNTDAKVLGNDGGDGKESPFEDEEEMKQRLIEEPLIIEGDRSDIYRPNIVLRYLQPWKYLTYHDLKEYIPPMYWEYPADDGYGAGHDADYSCPDLSAKAAVVWIPRDPMGLSKQFIEEFEGIVEMSDENAEFDQNNKIVFTGEPPQSGLKIYREDDKSGNNDYFHDESRDSKDFL